MNTAVLTGRQVYKTMKVFIVSQSGKVADITLQSSCHSEDESVIKVFHNHHIFALGIIIIIILCSSSVSIVAR